MNHGDIITKEQARDILTASAFVEKKGCDYCDHVCEERTIIHSILGGFGADHDLDGALALVESSIECAYSDNLMGHDLRVTVPAEDKGPGMRRDYYYAVTWPES